VKKPHGSIMKGRDGSREGRPSGRLIMGRNCVREALRACPQEIKKVIFAEGRGGQAKGYDERGEEIRRLVSQADIPVEVVSPDELSSYVNSDSHQSIAALMKSDRIGDLKELLGQLPVMNLLY